MGSNGTDAGGQVKMDTAAWKPQQVQHIATHTHTHVWLLVCQPNQTFHVYQYASKKVLIGGLD